ncbi:hypothetical protein Vretimale_4284, partial [Volvox reticuliferus]
RKMHAMASRYCARGQIAIFDRRLPPPSISLHTSSRHFIAIQHVQFTSMKCLNSNFFNISGKSDRGAIPRTALQSATAEAPTSPVREDSNDDESDLQNFLSWLVANGVQGIGQEGSKLALFQSENGERGLMCEEPVSKGDVVLEVPLRLALTDHSEDAESNQLLYPVGNGKMGERGKICHYFHWSSSLTARWVDGAVRPAGRWAKAVKTHTPHPSM